MKIFTTKDNPVIPDNVVIIHRNFGQIDLKDKTKTKSIFSWNIIFENDAYAGTYFVNHSLPVTKEFFDDVIGVLCQQIAGYVESLPKAKELKTISDKN